MISFIIEKRGRQAVVHTKETDYKTNMIRREIWDGLDERAFASNHGSYIVNLKYIRSIAGIELLLINGEELPVSRGTVKN